MRSLIRQELARDAENKNSEFERLKEAVKELKEDKNMLIVDKNELREERKELKAEIQMLKDRVRELERGGKGQLQNTQSSVNTRSSQAEAQVKELLPLILRHVHPEHYQKTLKDPELRKLLVPVHGKLAGRAILCTIRV